MVKHIVFWKLKDGIDKSANIDRMIGMLTALVGKIEGLVSIEMGSNFNTASEYDVALFAAFKNESALAYYQDHPEHVKCKEFIGSITAGRACIDYNFEDKCYAARPFAEVPDAPGAVKKGPEIEVTIPERKAPVIEVTMPAKTEPVIEVTTPAKTEPVIEVTAPAKTEPIIEVTTPAKTEPVIEVTTPAKTEPVIEVTAPAKTEPVIEVTTPAKTEPVIEVSAPVDAAPVFPNAPAPADAAPVFPNAPAPVDAAPVFPNAPAPVDAAPVFPNAPAPVDAAPVFPNAPAPVDAAPVFPNAPVEPAPMKFDDIPPAAPMRFDDAPPPAPMRFDDLPPAAPMRFDDAPPPAPMRFNDTPPAKPMRFDDAPAAPKPSAPVPNSTVTEKKSIFGKKKLDVQVTPLDQRSDTWTCPNCGKVMPNYVGTCGCGEIKPFEYEPPVPSDAAAPTFTKKEAPKAATPAKAPAEPKGKTAAATPNSTVTEKTNIFGKKKLEVQVTPLDQRSDTWTCPNCGKVMPNYVGTCGCGEIKPFEYEPPVPSDDAAPTFTKKEAPKAATPAKAPAEPKGKTAAATPNSTVTEKTNIFGKKKLDVQVTPLDQRSDTWTCPNCGKVMPNYVGTCGCGEIKPFEYEPPVPSDDAAPTFTKKEAPKAATPAKAPAEPKGKTAAATPNSTVTEKTNIFGKKKLDVQVTPLDQRSDTWTCPNCGKVMPNYVGTCGCGEIKPFEYEPPVPSDDAAPTFTKKEAPKAATPAKAPAEPKGKTAAATPNSTVTEKTNIFGKKKLDVQVTPLDQRSDTWTCPNCGKVMPNYVGTCGCGEIKPFEYEPPVPSDDAAPTFTKKESPKAATPANAPAEPKGKTSAATPNSTVTEKTTIFGKKKLEVQVTPLDQRSDTWTCPNCGKVMPNYVGTCGCGEIKPFEYEPPVPSDSPANNAPSFSASQPASDSFSGSSQNSSSAPQQLPPNTWRCPSCGSILPNYLGTCDCGEVKPFELDEPEEVPAAAPMSEPFADLNAPVKQNTMTPEMISELDNVQPSISGYNPMVNNPDTFSGFSSNAPAPAPVPAPNNGPDLSFIRPESDGSYQNSYNNAADYAPRNFDDAPPAAPMRFNDAPPTPMTFNDAPPASTMRFDNSSAPAPMTFNDAPPAAPMRFNDTAPAAAPKAPPVSAAPVTEEKKYRFGKKAKEQEILRQAQAVVDSRKDVPNDGTWTCPNCGKVMPKYVGTCGCGESQPFEF